MGKIADVIRKIQVEETLTLPEVFQKYPHLANWQYKELQEEDNLIEEQSKKKKLLRQFGCMTSSIISYFPFLLFCSGGGIGRHARLRGVWRKPCGFKSRSEHHVIHFYSTIYKIIDFICVTFVRFFIVFYAMNCLLLLDDDRHYQRLSI